MNIEFFCDDKNIRELWAPKPAADFIPPEISNLVEPKEKYRSEETPSLNIKSCPPAMDFMTAGYIMCSSYCIELESVLYQFKENIKIKTAKTVVDNPDDQNMFARKSLAVFYEDACPVSNSIKKQRVYFKFKTSWGIKTPPGYSCFIMKPYYLNENRYEILPAIVDTDTYHLPIPVTGYLNVKDLVRIEPGTPILQVIPFKRNDWNMSIQDSFPPNKSKFYIWNSYKRLFHKIKNFL